MLTLVVTGAAGFIGSRFCEYMLSQEDVFIFAIDNLTGGSFENLPKSDKIRFINADLGNTVDQAMVKQALSSYTIDYIYHYAATAWEGLSPFMRLTNYHNNLIATAFMINLGINHHVKRFVFTSSMAVYGSQNPPFDEDLRPAPIDPYGVAKYACEMDIQIAQEQHGMEFCIIRPHNVYGRNQNIFDPYRNVLGRWMYQAKAGQAFTIYGDGLQTRAFSFIDDCLPCLWRAATSPKAKNQIINLGGMKETALKDAADMLVRITETPLTPVHLEPRHEAKHAWSTYQKSVDLLDYKETFSLEEGLKSMWDSVKDLPMKPLAFYQDYEVEEGIYSYWKR